MKKLFVSALLMFATNSYAADFFSYFQGKYEIQTRSCEKDDIECSELTGLEIGYDEGSHQAYIVESYNNGSIRRFMLWEGTQGDASASITADAGLNATWTMDSPAFIQALYVYRQSRGAPLFYKYSVSPLETDIRRVSRRFELRSK